jgi:hypothetical protein
MIQYLQDLDKKAAEVKGMCSFNVNLLQSEIELPAKEKVIEEGHKDKMDIDEVKTNEQLELEVPKQVAEAAPQEIDPQNPDQFLNLDNQGINFIFTSLQFKIPLEKNKLSRIIK